MSKSAHLITRKTDNSETASIAPKFNVGREFADTTWRMAIPVVLFASLGIVLDRNLTNGPWFTLSGMVIGFVFAGILIRRQIKRITVLPLSPKILKTIKKRNQAYDDESAKNDYYGSGGNK